MLCFIAKFGRTPNTALTQALKTYQNTVQLLLDSESYPGLSREELETFKTTYRTEAYTCRYSRCPRTSNGFKSDQLRCQHENDAHRQSLKCTVPECKFGLSFASNRALKSHIQKYHSLPSTKNYPQSIRRLLPPSQGPKPPPSQNPDPNGPPFGKITEDGGRSSPDFDTLNFGFGFDSFPRTENSGSPLPQSSPFEDFMGGYGWGSPDPGLLHGLDVLENDDFDSYLHFEDDGPFRSYIEG